MSEAFQVRKMLGGVWQIEEAMGVCTALLCGTERALLVDTGYGLNDLCAYVRTITDKPLTVLLTHAHHDHALGARWFSEAGLFEADFPNVPCAAAGIEACTFPALFAPND